MTRLWDGRTKGRKKCVEEEKYSRATERYINPSRYESRRQVLRLWTGAIPVKVLLYPDGVVTKTTMEEKESLESFVGF